MQKVAIIGAGISGLAASVRMAVKGYEVTVYEANSYPGGKLSEFQINGFRFDAGPSLFTLPELVDELFTITGKNPSDFFTYQKINPLCIYFFEDGTSIRAHADQEDFLEEVESKTHIKKETVKAYLRKSKFIYEATAHLFLERSLHKISSYLRLETIWSILKLPFLHIFETMDTVNYSYFGNSKLHQLFNRFATYNGSDPYRASGILNLIPHLEFNKGAYFPEKGMHQITQSIYQLALESGVKFEFNSKVQKIEVENGNVKSIVVNNSGKQADVVICNMDVVPAYRQLLPDQVQPKHLIKQERSSSALIFYWGINREFSELDLHNIFFSGDYKKEFQAIFTDKTIYVDPTIYVNITSKYKKEDAPIGMENWFVMINVPSNDGQDWPLLINQARMHILQKLSRIMKVELSSFIITEEVLDPLSIETKTQSYKGSLYGTSSNNKMAAFFRHPNFTSKIKNLYFCGGSVHPGGGIPLALSSAKIVDNLIPIARK